MYCNQKKMMTLIAILQDAVCQAMTNDDPDDILFSFVARIGSFLGAGKAFLFDDTPIHFYCWTPDGMTYDTDRVIPNEDRQKLRGWFKDLASRGHPVFIANTADWPDLDSSIKEHMHRAHIHNVAAMAFFMPGNRIGAIVLENIHPDAREQADELLRLAGSFLLVLLKGRDHIYQMRNHSFIDQMTGVSNRNAFDAYQQHVNCQVSMGVLFADINNLKKTNDEEGHASGDRLICHTASILQQYRHGGEVFRIGGDEFVIIWQHVEEWDFYQACCQIRRQIASQNLNIARGYHWVPEAVQGLPPVLQIADEHMYEEKRRYHRRQVIRL